MWWLKAFLLLVAFGYCSICALLFFSQTALLFPTRAVGAAPTPAAGAERLVLDTADGERLYGIRLPGRGDLPILLAFAGNAWNAESAADYLRALFPDHEVIAFHYRGYAPSSGRPGAAALKSDALLIHDNLAERFAGRRIVAVGFSIGSGVAAHLAARRPTAGAILITPFDSLARVASGHYPWLPVRLLLRHSMEPRRELEASNVPVAVIAAGSDTIIPPARADALARSIPNLLFARSIAGAGHNDVYDNPDFRAAIREAVRRMHG